MKSFFLHTENGRVHVQRFGHGEQLLIALHGFAEQAKAFSVLGKAISGRYTTLALDLPFHGQTVWHKTDFSKEDLLQIIALLLRREGKPQFSLMGFSFGARLAMGMLPELVPVLHRLYLLSPDGIKTRGMGTAERTPVWLRRVLFKILQHPVWFISLVNAGRRLYLVPAGVQQFVRQNLKRPKRIQRAFGCWFSLDSFRIRTSEVRKILTETALPTVIFIGAEDTLLHRTILQKQYGGLPNVQISMLKNLGHRILGKRLAALI